MAKFNGTSFPTSNVSVGDDFYNVHTGVLYIFQGGDPSNINNWTTDAAGGNVPAIYFGTAGQEPANPQEGTIFITITP